MDVLFCCHSFYIDWQISNSLITCYFPFEIHVFSDRSHISYRLCDLHCYPGNKIQTRVEKYSLSHWYLLVNCKCKYHQKQWSRYWYYAYDTAHIWCAFPNSWLICTCASHCQWHLIRNRKNLELIKSTSGIYDLRKLAALRKRVRCFRFLVEMQRINSTFSETSLIQFNLNISLSPKIHSTQKFSVSYNQCFYEYAKNFELFCHLNAWMKSKNRD